MANNQSSDRKGPIFLLQHLRAPGAAGGGDPKYSVTLLIPKSDTATLNKIKLAIADAREAFCSRNGANAPAGKAQPHAARRRRPCATAGRSSALSGKGCYVITVSSRQKPIVVDNMRNAITDPLEVYSGCYGRAAINFFGYSSNGKKGISAGLLSIQKLHDGEASAAAAAAWRL